MSPEQDPLEERLRAALETRADEAQPRGDGLSRIRGRVAHRKRMPFFAHPALAAASSAGVVVIAVSAAAAGTGKIPGTPWAHPESHSVSATSHPGHQSSAPSSTSTETSKKGKPHTSHGPHSGSTHTHGHGGGHKPKKQVDVPVYYLTKSGSNWALQKSKRSVSVHRNASEPERAEAAIDAMLHDGASHTSPWNSGTTVVDTSLSASTLTVALSGAASSGNVNDGEAAQAALRQLVYTGTAAAPSASSVRLTIGGQSTTRFWGWVPVSSSGIGRSDPALTQSLNTITTPSAGATVSAPVGISGSGSYAQASASWQVMQHGSVVQSGSENTGTTGFGNWSTTVDLDPGTYRLRTYDGSAGGDQNQQTVRFTVSTPSSSSSS